MNSHSAVLLSLYAQRINLAITRLNSLHRNMHVVRSDARIARVDFVRLQGEYNAVKERLESMMPGFTALYSVELASHVLALVPVRKVEAANANH